MQENADAVEIFQMCELEFKLGFGSAYYSGINPTQMKHAFEIYGLDKSKWRDTQIRLKIMGREACRILNEKANSKGKNK